MRTEVRPSSVVLMLAVALGVLAVSGAAQARPKKFKQMNSCTCACRQDGENEVFISVKDFYSEAGCLSYNNTACDVTVSTSEGTRQVTGNWEGCVDQGKVWVSVIKGLRPDDLPKLTVEPRAVQPPPKASTEGAKPGAAAPTQPAAQSGEPPKPESASAAAPAGASASGATPADAKKE